MGARRTRRQCSLLLHLLAFSALFVLAAAADQDQEPFVGVNIGTAVSNLLSPADLAAFLQVKRITHVRLYDADASYLSALSGTGVRVVVGVPNAELIALGSSRSTAAAWVARRIIPFVNTTVFSAVAVGDEVPVTLPSALPLLLPAMRSLSAAIAAANLSIPVSTPIPFSLILNPFPPSQSFFNQTLVASFFSPLLTFLSKTAAPFMLNMYPYYSFMENPNVIPLDVVLFNPLPRSLEMVDANTLLHYTNLYDVMLDAVYASMHGVNVTAVPVLITETGWPSYGDTAEPYATKDNADTFNSNLIKHVMLKPGTPARPSATPSVYIYELFDEDMRPGPVSEANWGLFYGNGTPVYMTHAGNAAGGFLANDTTDTTFCIVADDADESSVQVALDWACGVGHADCAAIQPGEVCYEPNDVKSHASYAFDSYYQSQGKGAGSCYFQGVATVTTTDPSHGSCVFPGSKLMGNITKPESNATAPLTSNAACIRYLMLRTTTEGSFRSVLGVLRMYLGLLSVLIAVSSLWT